MKTATFIKNLKGWRGDARLYRVDPPMKYGWDEKDRPSTEYVIVSAAMAVGSGPETYIFPAKEDGKPINYGEMDGSFRGSLDHEKALGDAGYTVRP